MIRQVSFTLLITLDMDCSPANRERELGLDSDKTSKFYPTDYPRYGNFLVGLPSFTRHVGIGVH